MLQRTFSVVFTPQHVHIAIVALPLIECLEVIIQYTFHIFCDEIRDVGIIEINALHLRQRFQVALDFVVKHLSRQLHRQVFIIDSAESLHGWCFPFVLVSSDERHIHPVSPLYLVGESDEIEFALY